MKLYVLIMVHEHTQEDVSEYYKIFAGVFDKKEKAEKAAAQYLYRFFPYCNLYFVLRNVN